MGIGLQKLAEEDQHSRVEITLKLVKQLSLVCFHLDVLVDRLKREHKVETEAWGAPQVSYK